MVTRPIREGCGHLPKRSRLIARGDHHGLRSTRSSKAPASSAKRTNGTEDEGDDPHLRRGTCQGQNECCVPVESYQPQAGTERHGLALALLEPADKFATWGSWLGSLASASAVNQHQAAPGLRAEPISGAAAQALVGTRSALFGRLAIS
jgi:hypothetical protein